MTRSCRSASSGRHRLRPGSLLAMEPGRPAPSSSVDLGRGRGSEDDGLLTVPSDTCQASKHLGDEPLGGRTGIGIGSSPAPAGLWVPCLVWWVVDGASRGVEPPVACSRLEQEVIRPLVWCVRRRLALVSDHSGPYAAAGVPDSQRETLDSRPDKEEAIMGDPEPQTAAGKVLFHFLMSLDSFVAGPGHTMDFMDRTTVREGCTRSTSTPPAPSSRGATASTASSVTSDPTAERGRARSSCSPTTLRTLVPPRGSRSSTARSMRRCGSLWRPPKERTRGVLTHDCSATSAPGPDRRARHSRGAGAPRGRHPPLRRARRQTHPPPARR